MSAAKFSKVDDEMAAPKFKFSTSGYSKHIRICLPLDKPWAASVSASASKGANRVTQAQARDLSRLRIIKRTLL